MIPIAELISPLEPGIANHEIIQTVSIRKH